MSLAPVTLASLEFDGLDEDLAQVMAECGAPFPEIAETFDTDLDGVRRLLAGGWTQAPSARGPCATCGGTIRREDRRETRWE